MEELKTTKEGLEPEEQLVQNASEAVEPQDDKEPLKESLESMNREELVNYFKRVMDTHPILEVNRHLYDVHDRYSRLTTQYNEELKAKFIADGGEEKDFKGVEDYAQTTMSTLYGEFKHKRTVEQTAQEKIRQNNLHEKKEIINQINACMAEGDVSNNYNTIKSLIDKWNTIGDVPSSAYRDLFASFKKCKDQFFDNVRMEREIKENAYKRNYESKIKLCEQAEALLESSSVSNAFYQLQRLHEDWKAIGPVAKSESDALWDRFKLATAKVNERYHKQLDKNRDKEKENYEKKLALCEEVENYTSATFKSARDCEKVIKEVIELQQKWRTIGFAPKEFNDEVYNRFRSACDVVFENKRKFYKDYNNMLTANLAKKIQLCERAESLADSTDWKVTTDTLIGLQKRWKEIGPVVHKHSDEIWARFRSACDKFFENKNKHFSGLDEQYEDNLEKKLALIEELKNCQLPEDCEEQFKMLQDFQHRWNEIGFVPMKKKAEVNQMFSQLIGKHFDKLVSDDMQRNMQRFKSRVELMAQDEAGQEKLNVERNKLITKLRQIEADVVTLDNNIGFFSKSKQSDRLVSEVKEKIKVAKQNISIINEKLDILDSYIKE